MGRTAPRTPSLALPAVRRGEPRLNVAGREADKCSYVQMARQTRQHGKKHRALNAVWLESGTNDDFAEMKEPPLRVGRDDGAAETSHHVSVPDWANNARARYSAHLRATAAFTGNTSNEKFGDVVGG